MCRGSIRSSLQTDIVLGWQLINLCKQVFLCYTLFQICCTLHTVPNVLHATHCSKCAARYTLFQICCTLHTVPNVLHATRCSKCVTRYTLFQMCYMLNTVPNVLHATHCSKCALVCQSLLASKTLFSQCVRAVPSSPWSSSSAPSRSPQPKWLRTSSTTRGVTIICTSRSIPPPWTSQLLRMTDLITRSLHCLVRSLQNQSQLFLYTG